MAGVDQPRVVCVMLVSGRREMVRRAVASYRAQTYANKVLLIFANGPGEPESGNDSSVYTLHAPMPGATIGALRNAANSVVVHVPKSIEADIIAHFDSDDVSHPRRLEEQVALLLASGKACVGYREVLFWDTRHGKCEGCGAPYSSDWAGTTCSVCDGPINAAPESWLYSSLDPRYCVDASRMMWRSAWEECPYDDAEYADQRWWLKNAGACKGASSLELDGMEATSRLICQIHGTNMSAAYSEANMSGKSEWQRVPAWDKHCAEVMAL